jgi:DNA invertase Pin-like site-specific DNA recombinase
MARPGPDPRKVEAARRLAAAGTSSADIAAALEVSERTLSRWLGRPLGRPANGTSRWAEQRRRARGEPAETA